MQTKAVQVGAPYPPAPQDSHLGPPVIYFLCMKHIEKIWVTQELFPIQ